MGRMSCLASRVPSSLRIGATLSGEGGGGPTGLEVVVMGPFGDFCEDVLLRFCGLLLLVCTERDWQKMHWYAMGA